MAKPIGIIISTLWHHLLAVSLLLPPFLLLISLLHSSPPFALAQREQWDSTNYPNPTAGDWQRCNMRSSALLCDPDAVFTESERYRINYELNQLESSTRQEYGRDFCERKGITAALAIAKRVKNGNEKAVRAMANDMLRRWNIDAQCQKAVMIVLSVEDRTFWVARMPQVPVYGTELNELFNAEKDKFRAGQYAQGMQNIIRAIRDKALAKQQPPPDDGRSKGTPFKPAKPAKPEPAPRRKGGGGGGLFGGKMLLILAIILFVVIPLLCCCCCIYFCCCRNRNSENTSAPPPADMETGSGGAGGTGGRGGRGLGGLASGLPIGALIGSLGGLFNKQRRGGGGGGMPGGGGGGGGAQPAPSARYDPVPLDDRGGKALYPNVPVKDEGGGGAW